jgi:GAF domain-containing protein
MAKIFSEKPQPDNGQKRLHTEEGRYALAGFLLGIAFPVLAIFIKFIQLQLRLNLSSIFTLHRTEPLLWIIDTAPLFLGLIAGIAGKRQDDLLETNEKLLNRENELKSIQVNLEQLVADRTNELQQRNSQMRSTVYLARQIAEVQEPTAFPAKAVDLIAQHFRHYSAGLFLLDEEGKTVILQAASSDAGRKLLNQGYHINVGDQTIIGRAVERAKLYTAQISPGGSWSANGDPEVSKAQSEIALPLVARGKVIGVLDIQSEQPQAFDQNEAEVLQLLADQVAASIDNARLLSKSQAFVSQLETIATHETHSTWKEYLKNQKLVYQYTPVGVKSITPDSTQRKSNGLHIPLLLRGQEIGSITLQRKDTIHFSRPERDLAQKVSLQVALALDNSRLLEETRQHAVQEQTVNEISARFNRSLDVDTLLQTAVRELASLPEVSEASVFLMPSDEYKNKKINLNQSLSK